MGSLSAATSNGMWSGTTSRLLPRTASSMSRNSASPPAAPPLPMIPLGAANGLTTTWSPIASQRPFCRPRPLACWLVAQRRLSHAGWQAAHRDVQGVGPADAARPHPDEHVIRPDRWLRHVDHPGFTGRGHHRRLHGRPFRLYPAISAAMSLVTTSENDRSPKLPDAQWRTPSLTCIPARCDRCCTSTWAASLPSF